MKKILLFFILILVLASPIFAISPTSAVATVNLIKNKVIKQADLTALMQQVGATEAQSLEVLEILINDELFLQGSAREGITVSDRELESLIEMQKQNVEAQLGQAITEEDFKSIVEQQYGDFDVYKENMKNQYILQTYIQKVKSDDLENANVTPTDEEIRKEYNRNVTKFTQSENVKFFQIIVGKTGDATKDLNNKKMLTSVVNDIKNNKITFEAAVVKYSEDEESKALGGEAGWLASDNQTVRDAWGNYFVDTVLDLPVGQISNVIESNIGYHIVKNTVHNDAKFLDINDKINPEEPTTVYQYIGAALSQQMQEKFLSDLTLEIINELKAEASIRILI